MLRIGRVEAAAIARGPPSLVESSGHRMNAATGLANFPISPHFSECIINCPFSFSRPLKASFVDCYSTCHMYACVCLKLCTTKIQPNDWYDEVGTILPAFLLF